MFFKRHVFLHDRTNMNFELYLHSIFNLVNDKLYFVYCTFVFEDIGTRNILFFFLIILMGYVYLQICVYFSMQFFQKENSIKSFFLKRKERGEKETKQQKKKEKLRNSIIRTRQRIHFLAAIFFTFHSRNWGKNIMRVLRRDVKPMLFEFVRNTKRSVISVVL